MEVFRGRKRAMQMAVAVVVTMLCGANAAQAQQNSLTPLQLVNAMVAHESDESAHRDRYEFLSQERSDRTGGHLWTERVVETNQGRVRLLTAVDGTPLSQDKEQQERAKLQAMVSDPDAFLLREQSVKGDEARDRQMLALLPKAFLFDNVRLEDGVWKLDFHPNPDYSPSGLQERVLWGMSGWVAIDAKAQRLIHIEGKLQQDVSIGFGLLATIHAGSSFMSDRRDVDGHWRTVRVVTDIRGKAALFKSVSRSSDITRSDFHYLEPNTTIAQAVALLEQ